MEIRLVGGRATGGQIHGWDAPQSQLSWFPWEHHFTVESGHLEGQSTHRQSGLLPGTKYVDSERKRPARKDCQNKGDENQLGICWWEREKAK